MKTTQEGDYATEDDTCTVCSSTAALDEVENYEKDSVVFSSRKTYNLFDLLDSLLLCTFFSATAKIFEDEEPKKRKGEKTTVKVLATAFPRQENRDKDEYREFMNIDMLRQKSCIFVGEVSDSHQFKQGAMVTALKKFPIDTRFISIPSEFLISLPRRLDPGEASALISTYLPAFGILHHGARDRDKRFSPSCFEGKSILLVGGDVIEQEALVKLAFMGGAKKVSVLPMWKNTPTVRAGRFRGSNLDVMQANPEAVLPLLKDSMDLVIDLSFPLHFASVKSTIRSTGRLVARKNDLNRNVLVSAVSDMIHQMALFWVPNACLFDFDSLSMSQNRDVMVRFTFFSVFGDFGHWYMLVVRTHKIVSARHAFSLPTLVQKKDPPKH